MDVRDFTAARAAGFSLVSRGLLTLLAVSAGLVRRGAGEA
jgi:hypothetical protein